MKKMEGRAILCLILAAALIIGLVVFIARLDVYKRQTICFPCYGSSGRDRLYTYA